MSTATPPKLMTTEEFLAIAEEPGASRELIDGELREQPMTTRNRDHAYTVAKFARFLDEWLEQHGGPGEVAAGDGRTRLAVDPDVIVGIDVAFFDEHVTHGSATEYNFYDGAPVIAVEVLSPSDTHENVVDKLQRYLAAGTKQVWIADPDLQTVTIYRPHAAPIMFNSQQELIGDPELPGFRVHVEQLFRRRSIANS